MGKTKEDLGKREDDSVKTGKTLGRRKDYSVGSSFEGRPYFRRLCCVLLV